MRTVLLACTLLCTRSFAETLSHGPFHDVHICRPRGELKHVVLFLSGDEDWHARLDAVAKTVAARTRWSPASTCMLWKLQQFRGRKGLSRSRRSYDSASVLITASSANRDGTSAR